MIIALCMLLLLPCALIVAVPYLRLELHRRVSRHHRPAAQELWLQDHDQLLYVESVSDAGVALLTLDSTTRQLLRWTDSWPAWQERLRLRVVTFTGRTGSLNPWEAMLT